MSRINSGIYKILNIVTGSLYIGSSNNIPRRWGEHRYALNNNSGGYRLQKDWNLFGEEVFLFELIEYCLEEQLLVREQFYIDLYQSFKSKIGYNLSRYAGRFGHGEETRAKISLASKGRVLSKETRQKLREKAILQHAAGRGCLKGMKQTPESIAKRVATRKKSGGWSPSKETREKISNTLKGKPKNYKKSPEQIEATTRHHRGCKRSEETKRRISEAHKTPEYKEKWAVILQRRRVDEI